MHIYDQVCPSLILLLITEDGGLLHHDGVEEQLLGLSPLFIPLELSSHRFTHKHLLHRRTLLSMMVEPLPPPSQIVSQLADSLLCQLHILTQLHLLSMDDVLCPLLELVPVVPLEQASHFLSVHLHQVDLGEQSDDLGTDAVELAHDGLSQFVDVVQVGTV